MKEALGQYIFYADVMVESPDHSDRTLYLAVREETYNDVFDDDQTLRILQRRKIRLVIFNPVEEEIVQWKN